MVNIGERIEYLREINNMTQKELAKKIGISFSVMSRIESGDRPIRDNEIRDIARVFNVSSDYLLGLSNVKKYDCDEKEIDDLNIWLKQSEKYRGICDIDREKIVEYANFMLEKGSVNNG